MTKELHERIIKFTEDRNWDQFHSEENLAKSICIEACELLELYQWSSEAKSKDKVKEELADVLLYCVMMADKCKFDIEEIMNAKLDQNEKKYPVEKAYGNSKKYNEY